MSYDTIEETQINFPQTSTNFPYNSAFLNSTFTLHETLPQKLPLHTIIYISLYPKTGKHPLSRIRTAATYFRAALEAAQASQSSEQLGDNNKALVIHPGTTPDQAHATTAIGNTTATASSLREHHIQGFWRFKLTKVNWRVIPCCS